MFSLGSLFQQTPPSPNSVGEWVTIINAVGSLLLSVLLVLLYLQMYKIQKEQTETMNLQSKVMAASFKPEINSSIHSFDGDEVHLDVTNEGEGKPKNIRLTCQMYLHDPEGDRSKFQPAWDKNSDPAVYASSAELVPEESNSPFTHKATVNFVIKDSNGTIEQQFSEVLDQIEMDDVSLDFFLVYENSIGNRFVHWLGSISGINVGQANSLEEAIEDGSEEEFALLCLQL